MEDYRQDHDDGQQSCSRYNSDRSRQPLGATTTDAIAEVTAADGCNSSIERLWVNKPERWLTDAVVGGQRSDDDDPFSRHSRTTPNKILLVHGLDHVPVNCDRVFNLFCLYGNVTTVKVLKDDKVLVEMADERAAKRCVSNLHLMPLDDADERRLKVKYSKHSFICNQVVFYKLKDGTPAQKIYSESKLNRFPKNEMSSRPDSRRIAAPSKILHFFNAPIDVCGFAIHKAVSDVLGIADAIRSITILPKRPAAKCSTGLIELKTIALAAKTVFLSNHTTFESKISRFPFLTKLCFSKWSDVRPGDSAATSLRLSCVRSPWMLHESEQSVTVPAATFQISRTTAVTGGCGDCPWTLWTLKDDDEDDDEAADPDDRLSERNGHGADRAAVHSDLFDMLRNQLCGGGGAVGCDHSSDTATEDRDDRGGDALHGQAVASDVLQESTGDVGAADADVAVQVTGGGPLGDA